MNKLVIVESAGIARRLWSILRSIDPNNVWIIIPLLGNLFDLPPNRFGLDIITLEPYWETLNFTQYNVLIAAVQRADNVLIGTTDDNLGDSLATRVQSFLQVERPQLSYQRLRFRSLTKISITNALALVKPINSQVGESHTTRICLNRLFEYQASQIIRVSVGSHLNLNVLPIYVLGLLVIAENRRLRFKPKPYWVVQIETHPKSYVFSAPMLSEESALSLSNAINQGLGQWSTEQHSHVKSSPNVFTTCDLMAEAGKTLHLSPNEVLKQIKQLYELGLTTYYNTTSSAVSPKFSQMLSKYVEQIFGSNYVSTNVHVMEGPEGIRITNPEIGSDQVSKPLELLYRLIWSRTVASHVAPALYCSKIDTLSVPGYSTTLHKRVDHVEFDGFHRVLNNVIDDPTYNAEPTSNSSTVISHYTKPSERYTESTLTNRLHQLSEYYPLLCCDAITWLQREFYLKVDHSELIPTERGKLVIQMINQTIPELLNRDFVMEIEQRLAALDTNTSGYSRSLMLREYHAWLKERFRNLRKFKFVCDDVCPVCQGKLSVSLVPKGEPVLVCSKKKSRRCLGVYPLYVDATGAIKVINNERN